MTILMILMTGDFGQYFPHIPYVASKKRHPFTHFLIIFSGERLIKRHELINGLMAN
jgi:hypothetical protein